MKKYFILAGIIIIAVLFFIKPYFTGSSISNIPDSDVELREVHFNGNFTYIALRADNKTANCGGIKKAIDRLEDFLSDIKMDSKFIESGYCSFVKNKRESLIILEKSDYPYIWQPLPNCYILRIGDCEAENTVIKFIESAKKFLN